MTGDRYLGRVCKFCKAGFAHAVIYLGIINYGSSGLGD